MFSSCYFWRKQERDEIARNWFPAPTRHTAVGILQVIQTVPRVGRGVFWWDLSQFRMFWGENGGLGMGGIS